MVEQIQDASPEPDNTMADAGDDADSNQGQVESSTTDQDADTDSEKSGINKRFSELTTARDDANKRADNAEKDRDYWRDMAMRGQPQQPQADDKPTQQQPTPDETPKTLADFDYDQEKYTAYVFEQADLRAQQTVSRTLAKSRQQEQASQKQRTYDEREQTYAKGVEDFDQVAKNPNLPISLPMRDVIMESEEGPAIVYHLGKHPDVAARIANLPPMQAARELGRIEAKIISAKESVDASGNKVSQAPGPTPKLDGKNASRTPAPDDPASDKIENADEWAKRRNKQVDNRRK